MHLLPRDVKFYDQFLKQSTLVVRAAQVLRDATGRANGFQQAAAEIRDLERQGDEVEHEVYRRLHKTFITPIDPEDIHALSSSLDQVLDGIEALSYRMSAYGVKEIPERIRKLAGVVASCTETLHKVFEALNEKGLDDKEYVSAQCVRVDELEEETQALARGGVAEVFAREKDPIALLKLKEIYDYFEIAGDRCKDTADLLENVVAKNS